MKGRCLLFAGMAMALSARAQTSVDPGSVVGNTGTVQFTYRGNSVTLKTVRAADNKIWLQQNLGSPKVADSASDAGAYGDYFQFGRWDDGHQVATSTVVPSSTLNPNNPSAITTGSADFFNGWWSAGANTDTWTANAVSVTNGKDPCAALGTGWRLPTVAELVAVKTAEGMDGAWNAATIPQAYFNSNLKLPRAGYRTNSGTFNYLGGVVALHAASLSTTNFPDVLVSGLGLNDMSAMSAMNRDAGIPCRCIKTIVTPPPVTCTGTPTAPDLLTTATAICTGTTINLQATNPITVTGISYQWQQSATGTSGSWTNVTAGNGATTLDYTTATLTATTYFRVTATCSASNLTAASPALLITVNPIVTPSLTITADISRDTICSGTAVTFTAVPLNGGSTPVYQWKSGTANVGTNSPVYTDNALNSTAVITCNMTANAACATTTAAISNGLSFTVNTTVVPAVAVVATPNTPVCAGEEVTFTATSLHEGVAPVFQWKKNGQNRGTNSASYTYAPENNDAIYLELLSNAVCAQPATVSSDTLKIAVNALPEKPKLSVVDEVLTSSTASGNQWYRNNEQIKDAFGKTFTPTENGYYQVSVTDQNGCSNISDSLYYEKPTNVSAVALQQQLKVYPSPFREQITIAINATSGKAELYQVLVTNQLGQVVRKETFSGQHYVLSMNSLPAGIYFLQLSSGKGQAVIKVVKE